MTGPAANVVVFYAQVQARRAPDPGQGYRGFNHLTFVLRPLLAYFIKIQGLIQRGGKGGKSPPPPPPLAEVSPPPNFPLIFGGIATTLYYYAMFSAINVYTSASAHSINMFPPLAKKPVSIPEILAHALACMCLITVHHVAE